MSVDVVVRYAPSITYRIHPKAVLGTLYIGHCIKLWGASSDQNWLTVLQIQKRVIKYMMKQPPRARTSGNINSIISLLHVENDLIFKILYLISRAHACIKYSEYIDFLPNFSKILILPENPYR